jgi:tol-pal system protein YbgF
MISADLRYTTSDQFNSVFSGINDGYFNFQTGLSYNLKPTVFQRKSQLKREGIIALNTPQVVEDNVLERVALRSKINNLETAISLKNEQIRQIKSQLQNRDERITQIEQQIAMFSTQEPAQRELVLQAQTPKNDERSMTTETLSDKEIKQKYNQAVALFNSKEYQTAIRELKLLSNNFPNHLYASNFVYWIGECYHAQGQYADAVKSFEEVLTFDKSSKLDDALIMCGISYLKLGNPAKANEKLQELISKYPNSEYSGKARRLIQSIQNSIIS